MTKYTVLLIRSMSQAITVEADSIEEAAAKALDQNELTANVSNSFDDSGEVEVFSVSDATGADVWNVEHDEPLELRC